MSGRWRRLTGRPHAEARPLAVPATLTAAFLDLDHRQGIAQAAVAAAAALAPTTVLMDEWQTVAQRCYAAMSAYLSVTEANAEVVPTAEVARQLADATGAVDGFYSRHRRTLDSATRAASAASAAADAAAEIARVADQRLSTTESLWRDYPSVRAAHQVMGTASIELSAARRRDDLVATRAGADRLRSAALALSAALDRAPGRGEEATRAVTSVGTRLQALRTRAEGINDAISTLLRDFHADSSADLLNSQRSCHAELDRADDLLQQAHAAQLGGQPESALHLLETARTVLAAAAEDVDAPAQRLALLRQIRDDPQHYEQRARFDVRDAQRLAVDQGAQTQWGPALDAQVMRIDRIAAALRGRHPDYWRYHRELEDVSQFVAGIVARIRQESAR
ncbi:hypothetical protein FK535_07050 [Mycolicibacterium sp. 018/SC-01/001]|uniref:hypothetical protein n=1 Tax=Mycolicibacterium sp. 018/SC-01/001 TaxID=2592069 RepID=UPI00117C43A1|nr:hypothetical protein [Mycolicibacterium sp. 018/SC-01/001]TRW86220.1 hypothetical protein FK535_07050 [Mycolicibacterium sp. 018/SC-01/001]